MSSFCVESFPITTLTPIEGADFVELAQVGGYHSIVRKGEYKAGAIVLFIPPQALLPENILRSLNLWDEEKGVGKLSGKPLFNRVKAKRIRSVLSEGIVFSPDFAPEQGVDYANLLGISKWIPEIPSGAQGQIYACGGITAYSDLENKEKPLRKGGAAFDLMFGREVVITEKIHGSNCCYYYDGHDFHVSSKGRAGQGFALLRPNTVESNWYWHAAVEHDIEQKIMRLHELTNSDRIAIYGEVFGPGVQGGNFTYGVKPGHRGFRSFDVKIGHSYAGYDYYIDLMNEVGIETVPHLYRGECTAEVVEQLTSGSTELDKHIREGVIIRPIIESYDDEIGRLVLKSVSPEYKTKNNTEYV